jgi:hypothetical protein
MEMLSEGYGPTEALHQYTDRKDELRCELIKFHDAHASELGICDVTRLPRYDWLSSIAGVARNRVRQ